MIIINIIFFAIIFICMALLFKQILNIKNNIKNSNNFNFLKISINNMLKLLKKNRIIYKKIKVENGI